MKINTGIELNYRWVIKKNYDDDSVQKLTKTLKIPKVLAKVLNGRGHYDVDSVKSYFKPSLKEIHDPFLMDGMEAATERVLKAVRNQELIWVHGDYDVDGTASVALACKFIREIGGLAEYYIPDRFEDGYGLSEKSIDLALEKGAKILLTVDVGITSYEQLDYAKKKKLDTIICDHHEPGETLPEAYAILDPIKPGCSYPFKSLSACGVVFKLVQGISIKLGIEEKAFDYLDFVALSSAADMVPLVDENRALVYYGLEILNKIPRAGIKGLIHCTGLKPGNITASNIVFAIAPLINAAGRLGDAKRSVEMMMQESENKAFRIAQILEDENRKRRLFDQRTFEEAIPKARKYIEEGNPRSLVIYHDNWHAGVIGIVASRLVDKFNLPTVLLTNIEGVAKGSARSINKFDVHSALKKCDDLLLEYGGHKHAAGLSLRVEHLEEFRRRFDYEAQQFISKEMLLPEIEVDAELSLNELSPQFFKTLGKFAPYGFSNYKPIFISRGVKSVNGVKILGTRNIKFRAIQNNFVIDAIGLNLAHKIDLCTNGKLFTIVYNLETLGYNGSWHPQLQIKDIRPESNAPED